MFSVTIVRYGHCLSIGAIGLGVKWLVASADSACLTFKSKAFVIRLLSRLLGTSDGILRCVTVDKKSHKSKNMISILLLNQGNLCAGFDLSLLLLACCLSS